MSTNINSETLIDRDLINLSSRVFRQINLVSELADSLEHDAEPLAKLKDELHNLTETAELLKHSLMGINSGLTTFEEGFAVFLTLLDNSAEEEMKVGRVHSALRPMFDHFQVAYRLHNAVAN